MKLIGGDVQPKDRKRVLSDHKKVKKRLVPPFVYRLADRSILLQPTKWIDNILPEILWLGILNERYGVKNGTALALTLAKSSMSISKSSNRKFFSISAYEQFNPEQQDAVMGELEDSDSERLKQSLDILIALYPQCPLNFLYGQEKPQYQNYKSKLFDYQEILAKFFNKHGKSTMLMQSSAVYIGLAIDVLHIRVDNSLANLDAITKYPDTEESRQVASNVRATLSSLFTFDTPADGSDWAKYFWIQGFKLAPCLLKQIWEEYEKR